LLGGTGVNQVFVVPVSVVVADTLNPVGIAAIRDLEGLKAMNATNGYFTVK
jgi:hypothetical protein